MTDEKLHSVISATTWSGALISGVGALTLMQWLAIGGFVLAVLGFCVNVWHKIATYKLERLRLELDRTAR